MRLSARRDGADTGAPPHDRHRKNGALNFYDLISTWGNREDPRRYRLGDCCMLGYFSTHADVPTH